LIRSEAAGCDSTPEPHSQKLAATFIDAIAKRDHMAEHYI